MFSCSNPKEKLETFHDHAPLHSAPVDLGSSPHDHMISPGSIVAVTSPSFEHAQPMRGRVPGPPVHFEGEPSATVFKSQEK